MEEKEEMRAAVRVHITNSSTDWKKKKQSHTSLVHDTWLTNGRPSKRHATVPTGGGGDDVLLG
jgi:hypothetical protein